MSKITIYIKSILIPLIIGGFIGFIAYNFGILNDKRVLL